MRRSASPNGIPYEFTFARYAARKVMEGVRYWADNVGFRVLPEIELAKGRRVDGIMVPVRWDAPLLRKVQGHWLDCCASLCVEIKISREDFLAGVKKQQFERYAELPFGGCYLATPARLIRREEVPDGWGWICVGYRNGMGMVGTCRQHPVFRRVETPNDWLWKILFSSYRDVRSIREMREQYQRRMEEVVGDHVRRHLMRALWRLGEVGREEA